MSDQGTKSNRQRIETLLELVESVVAPYVEDGMKATFGNRWRDVGRVPKSLGPRSPIDAHAALFMLTSNWREVFQKTLPPDARDAASATMAGRNAWAHSSGAMDEQRTLRALSGGAELLEHLKADEAATTVRTMFESLQREMVASKRVSSGRLRREKRSDAESDKAASESASAPSSGDGASASSPPVQGSLLGGGDVQGLTAWRKVMPPREDVLTGRLNKDSFAANLGVADRAYRSKAGEETEADPIAFFDSTHLTRGLQLVLEQAGTRFVGGDAPSTIGLQTNFGGGKTHTLLSLFHMANIGDLTRSETLSSVRETLGRDELPDVRTAVFSGVDKGPDQPLEDAAGRSIRTLWGYVAWHLGGEEGLALVAAAEEAGTSPGAETMQKVLELTGKPSLVLLDELVVYIRQLREERFEAHLSFLQSLTEAAIQVPNALIVASLPASDVEAGSEGGREALRRLEALFGRVQSAWEPAQGSETYAVVRRRLFQEIDEKGTRERNRSIEAFSRTYRDQENDFPVDCGKPAYREAMRESYPIHPLVFDTLAETWGPLEGFQRTRGVLSLIARAIHASYMEQSDEPLILASSIRIDDPSVKGALIEPLGSPAWSSIIDAEVAGVGSKPYRLDERRPRFGRSAVARRAACAVFLQSAPGADLARGMASPELRLACVRPGDQPALFGEALRELHEQSAHLHQAEGRYWYGPKPTLKRVAQQREADIEDERVDAEVVRTLTEMSGARANWSRVHAGLDRALEASDERSSALVVLGPNYPHEDGIDSPAEREALDGLGRRVNGQRRYRNALLFLAADSQAIKDCRRLVRTALAWRSVLEDDTLDLAESQRSDARASTKNAQHAATEQIRKSWHRVLVPEPGLEGGASVSLTRVGRRNANGRTPAEYAWKTAVTEGHVHERLGVKTLTERIEKLWPKDADVLAIDTVREWYFEHLHMERVRDESVIAESIAEAVGMLVDAPFGYAARVTDGELENVSLDKGVPVVFGTGAALVRREVAESYLSREGSATPVSGSLPSESSAASSDGQGEERHGDSALVRRATRFTGVVTLDAARGAARAAQAFEDIVSELGAGANTTVRITLEIQAEAPDGFDADVVDIVTDNARTLEFDHGQFD